MFLLRSIGIAADSLSEHAKDAFLLRMVPFVERNYNLVELGPRGTGKSHLFQQVSAYSHLISGGRATVARIFVNMSTDEDLEWAVRIAMECRRCVKEQQKRVGAESFEIRISALSWAMTGSGNSFRHRSCKARVPSGQILLNLDKYGPLALVGKTNTQVCTESRSTKAQGQA